MNAFIRPLPALLAAALLAGLAPAASAQDIRARITLKNKKNHDVFLKGRGGTKWIRMETVENSLEMQYAPTDISKIDFIIDLASTKVDEKYGNYEFKDVAAILHKVLQPTMIYIDIPNNVMPFVQMYIRSLFWSEQFEVLEASARKLVLNAPEGDPAVNESQAFIAYCLLQRGEKEEALKLIDALPKAGRNDENDAAYWFAHGCVHLENGDLDLAQESLARVIGFQTKDFKWMPAGLYMAAKGYVEAHNYESADKVLHNISLAYPKSTWKFKVIELLEYKAKHKKDWEIAEAKRKAEEAKLAAFMALPFRERVKQEIAKMKARGELN